MSWTHFQKLARAGSRVALVGEIKTDTETPVSLLARYQRQKYAFLLESVEGGERWGRYSFVGLFPELIFKSKGRRVEVIQKGKRRTFAAADPLGELRKLHHQFQYREQPSLPRFPGGMVGVVAYDEVRFFEKIPEKSVDDLKVPDLCFVCPKVVLVLDSVSQTVQLVYDAVIETKADIRREYDRGKKMLLAVERDLKKPSLTSRRSRHQPAGMKWLANRDRADYEQAVARAREYIYAGDGTQTVLSIRLQAKTSLSPFDLYRSLRRVNPSPYLFYLKFGDMSVVGASPETMVRLEGREMTVRPIAGTRRRGKDAAEDQALERELLADPKERAEHIMLVDLGRNDLGRVAEQGTVRVDQLMTVERYSHVMHIVSNVQARLAPDKDAYDLLRATFPAGTLSGSPKVRAMQIIEELEPTRRGIYGGCAGYFSHSGNMDMAITIRSALFWKGRIYVQVGAGIVADSKPAHEYQECMNKAQGMIQAVENALNDR